MTAIFAGPGMLVLFLISAFLGALQPMPGAKEALRAEAPGSLIISMNAGGKGKRALARRSYLLVPASFQRQVMFMASKDELEQVTISDSKPWAFWGWLAIIAVALVLTVIISIPTLWRLYRPNPALQIDLDAPPPEDAQL